MLPITAHQAPSSSAEIHTLTGSTPPGAGPLVPHLHDVSPAIADAVERCRASSAHVSALYRRYESIVVAQKGERPVPPENLFRTASDQDCLSAFGGTAYRAHPMCVDDHLVGRAWFGTPEIVAALRRGGDRIADGLPHYDDRGVRHVPEANLAGRARIADILRSYDGWQNEISEWEDRTDIAAAKLAHEFALPGCWAGFEEVARTRAVTLGDFVAKASLLADSADDLADQNQCAGYKGVDLLERSVVLELAGLFYEHQGVGATSSLTIDTRSDQERAA